MQSGVMTPDDEGYPWLAAAYPQREGDTLIRLRPCDLQWIYTNVMRISAVTF